MAVVAIIRFFCAILFLLRISGDEDTTAAFDFKTLKLSDLKLLGDAHLNNATVRLTQDLTTPNSGAGRALFPDPIRFNRRSFSTFFSFREARLNPSSMGGGMAFVITSDDISVGDAGGCLGLIGGNTTGPFVAVEFDTLMDVQFGDKSGNHVGLDINSVVSSETTDLVTAEMDLKSGNLINAWIDYDGSRLRLDVFLSYSNLKPNSSILSSGNLNLSKYLNEFMFVGFSGSTEGSTEIHSIEWWSFTSSLVSTSESLAPSAAPFFSTPPSLPPSANMNSNRTSSSSRSPFSKTITRGKTVRIAEIVTSVSLSLAFIAGLVFYLMIFKKIRDGKRKKPSESPQIIGLPKEFSYKDLKSATKCFNESRIIGHGAFGTVYKGILPDTGDIMAVKRCSHHSTQQGRAEFLSELSIIGSLRHRNLVRLQGWCYEKDEILLVYDLMPNGSLDKALFESRIPLPWAHRRKILTGVASALAYLHRECEKRVIHRDVKSSNIMLDEGFNARLGDFGLARQIEHDKSPDAAVMAGTMGYLAPEYLLTGRADEKTDVFSYGALVLEVASGRRPLDTAKEVGSLVEWVWGLHGEGRLLMAADEKLQGEFEEGEMRKVLMVGLACSHPEPFRRPSMRFVVQMLVGEAEIPIVPISKPPLKSLTTSQLLSNLQDSASDCNGMITISTSSSENSFALELL